MENSKQNTKKKEATEGEVFAGRFTALNDVPKANIIFPADDCNGVPEYEPGTDDSQWRSINLPHDFVVEGIFSSSADRSHGYLPFGIAWYRKHFDADKIAENCTIWLDFEGIQTVSSVYLNGKLFGTHPYGYTPSRYFLNSTWLKAMNNVLAVKADATTPDGWWYDGGGIYRHVFLTAIATPGAYIAPWGVYIPSKVDSEITRKANQPFADTLLFPAVEIWNNASVYQDFTLQMTVFNAVQQVVGIFSPTIASVPANGDIIVNPLPLSLPQAALWHYYLAPPCIRS